MADIEYKDLSGSSRHIYTRAPVYVIINLNRTSPAIPAQQQGRATKRSDTGLRVRAISDAFMHLATDAIAGRMGGTSWSTQESGRSGDRRPSGRPLPADGRQMSTILP